ncbi:hypothetical protein GTW93_34230, partial [Streptomyces sp. SID5789]|nr:hypothetical protein [Streptomyces sp. SID5789]
MIGPVRGRTASRRRRTGLRDEGATMTTFILVSGMFTGTHIWQDTAARLTA